MRILLVAEGKHEHGVPERTGSLETLVRRLARRDADYEHDRLARSDIHAHHGKGKGYHKKALRWILEAAKRGFDAIVLVVDQDDVPARRHEIDDAQNSEMSPIKRALGVAIRSFDAWILADERALSEVLGMPVNRQGSIEQLRDPKGICERLLAASECRVTQTKMYELVTKGADLHTLSERCRRGFGPFAQRVKTL